MRRDDAVGYRVQLSALALLLQGAVMSLQIVPMVAGEETPDHLVRRGSEIASLLDGTPRQMGFCQLSAGSACWFAPLMPDKQRYSNA